MASFPRFRAAFARSSPFLPSPLAFPALATALLLSSSAQAGPPTVGPQQPIDAIDYVTGEFFVASPSVAFDGTNYFVAWGGGSWGSTITMRIGRVSPAGVALDPEPAVLYQAAPDYQLAGDAGERWLIGGATGQP